MATSIKQLGWFLLSIGTACGPSASGDEDSGETSSGTETSGTTTDLPDESDLPDRAAYVAVGDEKIVVSEDGSDWVALPAEVLGGASSLDRVVRGGSNEFVAVGGFSITESPDGIHWTVVGGEVEQERFDDVGFGDGAWVAVGHDGAIARSTNRTDWELATATILPELGKLDMLAFGAGTWLAGFNGPFAADDTISVMRSTDGLDWDAVALPALVFEAEGAEHGVWLNHLSHVDEQFTLVAAEQSLTEPPSKIAVHVLSSPDGESWQDQVIGGAGDDLLVTPLTGGTRCMEPWQGSLVALGEDWGLDQRPRLFITAASVETWSTIEGLAPGNATACASDGSAIFFLGRSLDPEPILFRSTDLPTLEPITLPSAVGPLSDLAM